LEAALRGLARQIDFPDLDMRQAVLRGLHGPRRPLISRRVSALAGILLVVLASLAFEPTRSAIATWLGIGRTAVETTEHLDLENLPATMKVLGRPVDQTTAEAHLGMALPESDTIGRPDLLMQVGPRVSLVWTQGVVLTLTPLNDTRFALKRASAGAVEAVDVNGSRAVWIEGEHIIELTDLPPALSGSVLLWENAGFEWRLETQLARRQAIELAEGFTTRDIQDVTSSS
jgi:hypothetical protein